MKPGKDRTERQKPPAAPTLHIDLTDPQDGVKDLRSGDQCPQCGQARLDYDGLLNLTCPNCGYAVGGCFT